MDNYPVRLMHGSGVTMTLDPTRALVATAQPIARDSLVATATSHNLVLESDRPADPRARPDETPRKGELINHTSNRYWVRNQAGAPVSSVQLDALRSDLGNEVEWVAPVYQLPNVPGRGGYVSPLPNVVLIRIPPMRDAQSERKLRRSLADAGLVEDEERSRYLQGYRYYRIKDPQRENAYQLRDRLSSGLMRGLDVRLENMPMVKPTTAVPNDPLFAQQWDMTQIRAGGVGTTGWDIEIGTSGVVIAVLDEGCDRNHPDLQFTAAGINLGTMSGDGSPTGNHGTACAGIAAAVYNNNAGVAGVAGGCLVMPIAFQNWTDAECATGIGYAVANGADVISMSFGVYAPGDGLGPTGWDFTIIDPEITAAVDTGGLVLCAATGNEDYGGINRYPARNERVIACGASDQADNRKTTTSPDGEFWWGSNFGPGMDVIAPGVLIPTTDRLGAQGYDSGSDYVMDFNGTSAATPHVAGFAALLLSEFPGITNQDVRNVIERTAAKVGTLAYADNPAMPNGTSNAEMGYGCIDVYNGLDFADLMIRDWWGDAGAEPSSPPSGNFWTYSDIVVRIQDDGIFQPEDPTKSSNIERGQTNYLYVRVTNVGPAAARNVTVNARIVAYVGTQFVYPTDWTATDAQHIAPTPITASFSAIPAGSNQIAKFSISSTQVEDVWGWISGYSWHPCIVASATCDNDYAFNSATTTGGGLITRRNNFAQRNVSVIDVLASATVRFPFVTGTKVDFDRDFLEVQIDRSFIPRNVKVELLIDEDLEDYLPRIVPEIHREMMHREERRFDHDALRFLDPVRVEMNSPVGHGLLVLESGSRLMPGNGVPELARVTVRGGEEVIRDERHLIRIEDSIGNIRFDRDHVSRRAVALQMTIPSTARPGDTFPLTVSERGPSGEILGGATVIYRVREQ